MARDGPDWTLARGIAGIGNLLLLLLALGSFPLVLKWTGASLLPDVAPESSGHTPAFVRFCLVVAAFLWTCFAIVVVGLRRRHRLTLREVIGARWSGWRKAAEDFGVVLVMLAVMVALGNLSNALFPPAQHDSAIFRSMTAQNTTEAGVFLFLALTAGFVEEVVFRGYLQQQLTILLGTPVLGAFVQVGLFTAGHAYQGWNRLAPVAALGCLLTAVALWKRRLVPCMIAHGLGDGLVAFIYFARHL